MRNVLLIVNTYYQLIISIQLKYTVLRECRVVLLISDHSKGTESIANKMAEIGLFDETHYIHTKDILKHRKKSVVLKDYFDVSFRNNNRFDVYVKKIENRIFDEIILYNFDIDIIGLYSVLRNHNPNLKVSFFEEGILSYENIAINNAKWNFINLIWKLRGKQNIKKVFMNFYCFYPLLYKGKLKTVKVPQITSGDKCSSFLKMLFSIDKKKLEYNAKYIFFTSVYDFEGGEPIGEFNVLSKIRDIVGNDNLLVKIHPRDSRSIYSANGFNIDSNSNIPWEVIQISGDFSDNIFLTVNSGSVLAGSLMTEKPTKTFYLYKLCNINNNISAQKTTRNIYSLLNSINMKSVLREVVIADEFEDIIK